MHREQTIQPTALIIEDDEKLLDIFSRALGLAGFDITSASDGQKASLILHAYRPAVIILDLHLPGIPGDKILAQIRQDDNLKGCQVILATADPAMADLLHAQCDYVLEKPISFIQLRDLATRIRSTLVS